MTRLIRASEDLLELIGTRAANGSRLTFEWGEPDAEGVYTPVITTHDDDPARQDMADGAALRRLREIRPGWLSIEVTWDDGPGTPIVTVVDDEGRALAWWRSVSGTIAEAADKCCGALLAAEAAA